MLISRNAGFKLGLRLEVNLGVLLEACLFLGEGADQEPFVVFVRPCTEREKFLTASADSSSSTHSSHLKLIGRGVPGFS